MGLCVCSSQVPFTLPLGTQRLLHLAMTFFFIISLLNSYFCVLLPSSDAKGHNSLLALLSPSFLGYHSSATRAMAGACGKAMRGTRDDTWEGRMDGTEEMRNRGRRRYPGSWKSPQKIPAEYRFAAAKQEPLLPPERVRGCFGCLLPKRLCLCWRRRRSSSAAVHGLSWKM